MGLIMRSVKLKTTRRGHECQIGNGAVCRTISSDFMSQTAKSAETFNEFRYNQYHDRGQALTIDKIARTSKTLVKQIRWA